MQMITTSELVLEPLTAAHAADMFDVLADDPDVYRYLDYSPSPSVEQLRADYARLEARKSPDGSQLWLNWVVRPHGNPPVGYVQATIVAPRTAWVAYVLSSKHWGRGYGRSATSAMLEHLTAAYDVGRFLATTEAENERSIRLLEHLNFHMARSHEAVGRSLSATERLFVRCSSADTF